MIKLFFISLLVLFSMSASSQFVYKIKADSVLITKDSCDAELNLENHTRNVLGFLFNKGNGRTEFRKALIPVEGAENKFIIGGDTLTINPGLQRLIAYNGLTKTGDSIRFGGDLNDNTILNLQGHNLHINIGQEAWSPITAGNQVRIMANRSSLSEVNDLYLQSFYTGSASGFNSASDESETFWQPSAPLTSGKYANFLSNYHGNGGSLQMSGVTLFGFESALWGFASESYGNFYHFYAHRPSGQMPMMVTTAGLYVEPLKGSSVTNAYGIYTAGPDDTIYNAGPVRWTRYKNNSAGDSVLTTDDNGNVVLKAVGNFSALNGGTNFILNQFASAQSQEFWINGKARIDDKLLVNRTDSSDYKVQVGGRMLFNGGTISGLKNNSAMDSVLTTDSVGNIKLIVAPGIANPYHTLTDSAVVSWDYANGSNVKVVLAGDRTLAISNVPNGKEGKLMVTQDSVGHHTLTLPINSFVVNGGMGIIPLSSAPKAIDVLEWTYDGANYFWKYGKNYQAKDTNTHYYDTSAVAFFDAAGITDTTQKRAVNELVTKLKNKGIWSKLLVIYPFVGGDATKHSYNLKNPAVHQMVWSTYDGGAAASHTSAGVVFTGESGVRGSYGNTGVVPYNELSLNSSGAAMYTPSTTSENNSIVWGSADLSYASNFEYWPAYDGSLSFQIDVNTQEHFSAHNTAIAGFHSVNRVSANSSNLYRQGTRLTDTSSAASTQLSAVPIYLGATNYNNALPAKFTSKTISFFTIKSSFLNSTEEADFYDAVQTFETIMGRQVN